MPFFLPFLIAGVSGALSGVLGGRKSTEQKASLAQQLANMKQAAQLATTTSGYGQEAWTKGMTALEQPTNYWSTLLSGDKRAMMEALAPEVSGIKQGYASNLRTSAELTPRGGMSAISRAEAPFAEAKDIQQYLLALRPTAATQLGNLGTTMAGLGTGMYGTALSGLSTSSGTASNIYQQELERKRLAAQLAAAGAAGGYQLGKGINNWWSARKVGTTQGIEDILSGASPVGG